MPATGPLGTWATGALAAGPYTLRLTVRDQAGGTPSVVQRVVYVDNTRRGDEGFYSRVPFDLGGGWTLDIGVANGEARLARNLFAIPSYGPAGGSRPRLQLGRSRHRRRRSGTAGAAT